MLADMQILAPADEEVLTREALDLVARLHRELNPRRRELLERRRDRQTELDAGDLPRLVSSAADVRDRVPSLRVLGGCCGTDSRHVAALWGVNPAAPL